MKPFELFPSEEMSTVDLEAGPSDPAPVPRRQGVFARLGRAIRSVWKGIVRGAEAVWGTLIAIDLIIKVTRSLNRLCKDGTVPGNENEEQATGTDTR